MGATDGGYERRRALVVAVVLGVVATLAAVDLIGDLRDGTTVRHAVVEGTIVLVGILGIVLVGRHVAELRTRERDARQEVAAVAVDLERSRAEASRWRAETQDLLAGLGVAIDRQLVRWGLTAAEKDIAMLLLKGLSHKEIATARGVSEATVRQQARGLYKKADLGGRHDLAAFFLEDLLAPRESEPRSGEARAARDPGKGGAGATSARTPS